MRKTTIYCLVLLGLLGTPVAAVAQDGIDTGDNAWILTSSALVLMMTGPGLALFYGGPGSQEKHSRDHDAVVHHDGLDDRAVGDLRIQPGVRRRQRSARHVRPGDSDTPS